MNKFNWPIVIFACLTLGLAPLEPPHIWEKLNILVAGTLAQPADIFDFLMHGAPWILLMLKIGVTVFGRKA